MPDDYEDIIAAALTPKPKSPRRQPGLDPQFQSQVDEILGSLKQRGLSARVSEGYRTPEKQNEYYAQGRTKPGPIVTYARGNQSRHTQRLAADIDLIDERGQVLPSGDSRWSALGEEAQRRGLTWGGAWKMKDLRHVESRRTQDPYDDVIKAATSQKTSKGEYDDIIDAAIKNSGQILPPFPELKTKAAKPAKSPVTPALAKSVPKPTSRPRLFDPTVPQATDLLKPSRSPTFEEDRARRVQDQKAMDVLKGRAGAATDFAGEEYQNFLRLNRTLDSPRRRDDFLTLKAKQAIASSGSPYSALLSQNREAERQQRVSKMSTAQKAAQVPKSLASGLASGVGSTLKGVAVAGRKLADQAIDTRGLNTEDTHFYRLGDYVQKRVPELLGSNPDLEQEFFVGKAPQAVGQSISFLLGGVATKAPKLTTAILGGGMTAGGAYDEVKAAGGTDEEAVNAGLLAGAILGPTELLGMRGAMKAISGTAKEATINAALKTALREGRRDAIENALQEAGQEFGQGLITGQRRSPEQLAEAALLGGLASGVVTPSVTLATQVGGRRGTQTEVQPPVEAQRETVEPATPTPSSESLRARPAVDRINAAGESAGSGEPQPAQRFYHKDFGEVEVLEDQSGARPGRVKVAEVADPTKQHFPKRSDLAGRGNQRMVPVKAEPQLAAVEELPGKQQESQRNITETITAGEPSRPEPSYDDRLFFLGNRIHAGLEITEADFEGLKPKDEKLFREIRAAKQASKPANKISAETTTPLEAPVSPTVTQVSAGERTAAGFKSDLSLSQFVRKMGGIVPADMYRGELDRLRLRDTRTTGLINQKAKQGNIPQTADIMMQAANHAGYRDPKTGQQFEHPGDFLYAVERDVLGDRIRVSSGMEDFSTAEAEYYAEQESRTRAEEARNTFLESGRGAELFDRIVDRKASDAERQEYIELAETAGISRAESEDLIADARAEIESLQGDGSERTKPPPRPAEQLGFVQEGLTQQTAPPPQLSDERGRLIRAEQDRQAQLNPERTAALAKLEDIRRRGMTVDDYARQPDLTGNVPRPEEVAILRELEADRPTKEADRSTESPDRFNFGPGTMRAGEPLPEVKERKFGKRFTEDERIADEIRSEIGTAKYYEPVPNKLTAAEATKLVDERGIGESIRIIRDEKNDLPAHIRSTMGQIVIQKLNQTYRNLKAAGSDKAEGVLYQAVDLAEWAMDYGTRLGQGVQSFAMWARLTPEGKLLTYKRAVKKARARHQKLYGEDVAEIVNTINRKDLTNAEREEALRKLFKTNQTARKVKSDFQKLLEAAKTGQLTDALFYEIVGERLGLPKYDRETAEKITDLAQRIEAAPEGLPRTKLVLELQKFIAEQKGFDVADLPLGIFYGNILSGYNTQAVNFADTGLNVLSEINGLALNNPQAAAKIYAGMLRGFAEGRWDAMLAMTEGRMFRDSKWLDAPGLMEVAKFGQKGGVPIKTETAVGRFAKRAAESKIAIPLNAYKYVSRAMSASDALMARSASEARSTLLAYKMAKDEGLTGSALETRVREILALDRESDFEAQASREGFTGKEAHFRAHELREMARPKDLTADAAEFAGEATYNHKPHGTLGLISERIAKLSDDVKPLKLFVPFTRIVANVTNRGLNYTPYGYKRAFVGWGFGKNAEPLTAEGRRLMMTRATMGTAGMVLLAGLQEAGLMAIHGNGPSDREKRRQLQNAGWRPYSLQIGNTYVSYVYSPVGLGLSIIGNMKDADRYHELQQKDAATRGAYAVARLGSTIFSQSFLSGLSRLFSALSDRPEVSVTAVKQTLGGTTAAFAVPNIVRDIHRLFDNTAYQSNTLMEDLIRNTPIAALALNPQLNAFGERVTLQRQRFFDIQTSDPAWQFVIKKGLRVPVPGRTTEISGKRITPEQYYQLLKKTGPQIKQWVIDNESRLQLMTETDAQDELSDAATAIRKRALAEMRGKMVKPMKPPAPPKPEAPARP